MQPFSPTSPALPRQARRSSSFQNPQAGSFPAAGGEQGRRGHATETTAAAAPIAVAAAWLALCPLAQAAPDPQEPPYGISGRVGLVVANVPTYEGSPNRRTLVGPDLTLTYRSREWGTVEFGQRGLFWNALESGLFRLALVAQFDPGRTESKPSSLNPIAGDKRLAGMGKVPSSTEAGVGIGYGPFMVVARQSLSERGHKGAQVDMTIEMPWSVSDRLNLRLALGATWADRDYMQTHFGVTAAQAQATSFAAYTPKAGCRKVEANVGAEYTLASRWKLQASVGLTQLGDVAAASPIVGRKNNASAALGLAHEF